MQQISRVEEWFYYHRQFKCRVLIDTEEYECGNRFPPKGVCSGSREFFKFWEISDNISESMQYRDIVAIKH